MKPLERESSNKKTGIYDKNWVPDYTFTAKLEKVYQRKLVEPLMNELKNKYLCKLLVNSIFIPLTLEFDSITF
ncbi:MAG: hypothetical protein CVU46_08510 [Chloroflexi bacterium HGW-Chloroflexi-8]|jgi:hypothetical protein|nr:MAG: hypothetical protein CVU46_08510 [Chloroflexi bacterium HGW-Chloroflexi-8]